MLSRRPLLAPQPRFPRGSGLRPAAGDRDRGSAADHSRHEGFGGRKPARGGLASERADRLRPPLDRRAGGDPADQKDYYSFPEVTAPTFSKWRAKGAKLLLTGFVRSRPDGRLTFGCYAYDVQTGRELGRKGFVVAPDEWRRAAHKCSGVAYTAATGAPGIFDTRIAYVAETGAGDARVKRIAVMDSDGTAQTYVTAGDIDRPDPAAFAQSGNGSLTSVTSADSPGCGSSTWIPASSARWSRSTR